MASVNFINECKKYAYENRYGKLYVGNGDELNQSNVIQNFTIDSGAYNNGSIIGSVYCKKLNAQLIDSLNKTLENESITAQVGVRYNDNTEEYINLGKYNIEKPKDELTDNYTSFVAYDDLANKIDKVYVSNINYSTPKTLGDLYQDVCINLDLVPKTTTFLNSDIPITNNPFTNKETNRFVLETICKIAASYVDIDVENNKIDLVWLSDNEEPDYIFLKSDYSTVNGGKIVYGPVNTLVIRSASVESENVSISDSESIEEYGEHEIVITDDYILNTPQLRQQALNSIWNRVHNLQYVDCELTTLVGKPFLKIGEKIRIYTSEEEYFDTYVLQHEFTYDGTFKSVIKSPAMTEQEVAIKQDISLGEKLSLTSLTVDKQNQTIQSVVSNVNQQDEKISQITQTVNEINSKISDIADITTSAEDTDAKVELNEINTSEPIQIKIHPTGTNISYLYPRDNLYPSDTLYMTDRKVRFHNTTTDENFDFILPDDLLYYDSEHYDEFLLDYGDGTPQTQLCQVTKRCKYNADGTVSLLNQEEITNYTYPSIPLTDGDYEVSIYGYQQGYIFTRLMTKNIYTTQFYTKSETNTLISQTAESITLEANAKFTAVNGKIDENTAKIVTNANAITNEVSRAQNSETTLSTRITQNANSITSLVSSKVGNNEVISKINQTPEQIQINANKISLTGKQINLTGDDVSINSTNFSVDKNGNVEMSNGKIENGTIDVADMYGNEIHIGSGYYGILVEDPNKTASVKIQPGGIFGNYDSYNLNYDIGSTGYTITDKNGNEKLLCGVSGTGISSNGYISVNASNGNRNIELMGDTGEVKCVYLTQTSLEEQKKNFEKLENALEIIKNTDIYKYHLKEQDNKEKKHIGFVIGDKFKYSKEITSQDNDAVDLYSMIGVCFKAIQEQQEEIERLKEMIK